MKTLEDFEAFITARLEKSQAIYQRMTVNKRYTVRGEMLDLMIGNDDDTLQEIERFRARENTSELLQEVFAAYPYAIPVKSPKKSL